MQAPLPPPAPRWRQPERSPSPPLQRRLSLSPAARSHARGERALSRASTPFAGAAQPSCEAEPSPTFKPGCQTVERVRLLLAQHAAERAAVEVAADAWLDGPQQPLPLSPPKSSPQRLAPRATARTPLAPLNVQRDGLPDKVALLESAPSLPTPLRDALPTPTSAGFTFSTPPAAPPLRMPAVFSVWQDAEDLDDCSADEAAADAFVWKRRGREVLRTLARAVRQSHVQLEAAAQSHRERTAAKVLHGWGAVLARARRRTSLSLVSELRGVAARLHAAFRAWASFARGTALLRDQHGAAAAMARHRQLAHVFAVWRTAADCRAPRLLALRPLLGGWRTAAKMSVAASRTLHTRLRRRHCFRAWAAYARSCGGVGARKARAHAALAAFQGAHRLQLAAALRASRMLSLHLIRERGCRAQRWAAWRRRVRTNHTPRHTHVVWRAETRF